MITVTKLGGARFAVNADLIERIQETPDTTLMLTDGVRYIVTESLSEVIDLIAAYRARVLALAFDLRATPPVAAAPTAPVGGVL
jgi:flagellar protein FlbD